MTMYSESLRAFLKPVLPFLDDDQVTEVLINGPEDVWVERRGRLYKTEARFTEEGLLGAARNMAQFVGRPLSDERPRLDARLPDGSRIHVVLQPVARRGTTISIRKFFREKPSLDALLKFGSLSPAMGRLIEAAVHLKLNVMVAGGTGSGKTTLLNIIASLIPDEERVLTIEDSAELQVVKPHLVTLESRPPDKYGKGAVDMGDLLHTALRLRPDRIIVGEVRGGECFHLMQAMNTGHGGSMSTVHANTPTDTLRRLESLCLMSAVEMPMVAVRASVASAINLVISCDRLLDGSRKVTSISQVLPLNERGDYRTQELFVYTQVGKDESGGVIGYHAPTGLLPTFLGKARAHGFGDLNASFFDPATYALPPPPRYALGDEVAIHWAPSLKHRERGEPEPESAKAEWDAFEQRLKDEAARALAAQPPKPTAPAATPATARPAPARVPPPPAPPVAKRTPLSHSPVAPTLADADATPPPSRPPVRSDVAEANTNPRAMPPFGREVEPLVQVSEDLVKDAASHNTAVRTYPPAKPPARPDPKSDPDRTNIKPVPERFRK